MAISMTMAISMDIGMESFDLLVLRMGLLGLGVGLLGLVLLWQELPSLQELRSLHMASAA